MMGALLRVRFRALAAGLTAQGRRKGKHGVGMMLLFAVLYLYVMLVICGMMGILFDSLAAPYHAMGLDWLYFAMAGLMALGFSVLGSVFSTQSQLYDAKDNDLLLAMPVRPWMILLSRMIPLLALNLLFASLVMGPAVVVYAVEIGVAVPQILSQLAAVLAITVLAQAVACFLGWLLHLLLSKMNKSVASMLYMVVFFVLYFTLYSQAGDILNAMAQGGEAIADTMRTWVWPLYAMGRGCLGNLLPLLAFAAVCGAVFAVVYGILTVTFFRTATMRQASKKRRKLDLRHGSARTPMQALVGKECRKFLGCPVYLTNTGMGVILTAALPVLGLVFQTQILDFIEMLSMTGSEMALVVCAVLTFSCSSIVISTPSVSLEGKNIWILKSMPVSPDKILLAKLRFHCILSVPVAAVAGLVLCAAFGGTVLDIALCAVVPALTCVLCGFLGMVTGLRWARLDYISEAYPCKQSAAILITTFGMMGLPVVFGLLYGLVLAQWMEPAVFLIVTAAVLAAACFGLYRLLLGWGVRKWQSL